MKSVTKLFRFLKPYWMWAVLAPLLMALEVVMDLMQPRMVQRIVDEGIAQFDIAVVINTGLLMIGYALIGSGEPSKGPLSGGGGQDDGQKLLEIAERVITACAESNLNADVTECQKLCKGALCCFDDGEHSCADDESKACGVYGGCEALIEGIPLGAGKEDEG